MGTRDPKYSRQMARFPRNAVDSCYILRFLFTLLSFESVWLCRLDELDVEMEPCVVLSVFVLFRSLYIPVLFVLCFFVRCFYHIRFYLDFMFFFISFFVCVIFINLYEVHR